VNDLRRRNRHGEMPGRGADGKKAPPVSGYLAYCFGWFAFLPSTLLFGGEQLYRQE